MKAKFYNESVRFSLNERAIKAASLEEAGYRVYERQDFHPRAIFAALGKGGFVLPIISGSFFNNDDDELVYTAILQVNRAKEEIILYDPYADAKKNYAIDAFIAAWEQAGSDCTTAFNTDARTYLPTLPDLSHIQLPSELIQLGELMAERNHDAWALERQSEGWTYGNERNDRKLETPDMVPYAQLPESEKEYDRIMATSTIKLLIDLGYDITKKNAK